MLGKFGFYDILGAIIPGVLLTGVLPLLFPSLGNMVAHVHFPESFAVLLLIGVAFFLGQLVQSLGSLVEPLLFWSWGGRPSDSALTKGLGRYLGGDSVTRIVAKLSKAVGPDTTKHSLFLYAEQLSDAANIGRAARFNGLYTYHRSLFALSIVMLGLAVPSAICGALSQGGAVATVIAFCSMVAFLGLLWHRTRQRAFYYVREVMFTAERILDSEAVDKK